uniref:Uncharacterized protein n=1 Tax=Setaria italica TaxID=4555 RepID=K4AH26_SETIT
MAKRPSPSPSLSRRWHLAPVLLPRRRPPITAPCRLPPPARFSSKISKYSEKSSSIPRRERPDGVRADHFAAAPHSDHHRRRGPLHRLPLAECPTKKHPPLP